MNAFTGKALLTGFLAASVLLGSIVGTVIGVDPTSGSTESVSEPAAVTVDEEDVLLSDVTSDFAPLTKSILDALLEIRDYFTILADSDSPESAR